MATKNTPPRIPARLNRPALFMLFLSCAALFSSRALFAQEGSYYLDRSGGDIHFVQRLSWEEDEYVYRYEVIIEEEGAAGYQQVFRDFTGKSSVEFSLSPGRYRYRIRPYDLLDRPVQFSSWNYFEILPASDPELRSFSPASFYLDEDTLWELNIEGRNLSPDAEVYLRAAGSRTPAIFPLEYTGRGARGRLVFGEQQLSPGTYEIFVKNPGGLETSLGGFRIAFRKPVDFYAEAGYSLIVPVYGDLTYLFPQPVLPFGAALRLGVIPFKKRTSYMGAELLANWQYFSSSEESQGLFFHALGVMAQFLYQHWISSSRTLAFRLRAGAGINMLVDFRFAYSQGMSEPMNLFIPQAGLGASALWLIRKPFFVEAGVDYAQWFSQDPAPPGLIRTWIGAGVQF